MERMCNGDDQRRRSKWKRGLRGRKMREREVGDVGEGIRGKEGSGMGRRRSERRRQPLPPLPSPGGNTLC